MFPPPNCYNPFDDDQMKISSPLPSFPTYQNPSHSETDHNHHDHPFLFTFPVSPSFDERDLPLNQMLLQTHHIMDGSTSVADHQYPTNEEDDAEKNTSASRSDEKRVDDHRPIAIGKSGPLIRRSRNLGPIPRKRTGKKDRHSKICTAQGIRDRRMRLSLQAARKFFDLQDMLGYDKASKTIEWLFTKSNEAIMELIKDQPQGGYYNNNNNDTSNNSDAKSESFVSECEVASAAADATPFHVDPSEREGQENWKMGRKPNLRSESREKARARARWRTREKMMIKILEGSSDKSKNPNGDDDLQKLGFSSGPILEGVDQESIFNNQERVSLYGNLFNSLEQQFRDVGTIEKFLGNSSLSCPNSDHYSHIMRSISGDLDPIFGNCDVSSSKRINSVQYSVPDQVLGENPSSIYSGHSITK
ncbi:hypothetical protein OROGR_002024 [Orobanche gracilis]